MDGFTSRFALHPRVGAMNLRRAFASISINRLVAYLAYRKHSFVTESVVTRAATVVGTNALQGGRVWTEKTRYFPSLRTAGISE